MTNQQDNNSHELHTTHYQNSSTNKNNPNTTNDRNHNAFGDDSDSEEQPNRDQSPEFDVYKDFNNSGVRYATLLNQNKDQNLSEEDVNQNVGGPTTVGGSTRIGTENRMMDSDKQGSQNYPFTYSVTSPTGDKYKKKRTKFGLNKALIKDKKNRWKVGSIVAFIAIACLGVLIFFLIPRQPFISFESPISIHSIVDSNNNNDEIYSKAFTANNPTNFLFDAQISLALDGRGSYLPTLIRDFKVIINDLGSTSDSVRVGKGQLDKGFTASSTKLTFLNVNVTFQYDAKNSSDTLWQNWRKACGNINQSTINGTITRPSLQLYLILSFNVIGIIGSRADSTQLNNIACPIQLPVNSPSF